MRIDLRKDLRKDLRADRSRRHAHREIVPAGCSHRTVASQVTVVKRLVGAHHPQSSWQMSWRNALPHTLSYEPRRAPTASDARWRHAASLRSHVPLQSPSQTRYQPAAHLDPAARPAAPRPPRSAAGLPPVYSSVTGKRLPPPPPGCRDPGINPPLGSELGRSFTGTKNALCWPYSPRRAS